MAPDNQRMAPHSHTHTHTHTHTHSGWLELKSAVPLESAAVHCAVCGLISNEGLGVFSVGVNEFKPQSDEQGDTLMDHAHSEIR